MKKEMGAKALLFPMPVYMIATYSADGSVDVMNMAWATVVDEDKVLLSLDETHKTSQNIKERMAFTMSIADVSHVKESDYFGIASANTVKDKFERSGLHAEKSSRVDAPIIVEYPVTLECKVLEIRHGVDGFTVVGEVVNTLADESVLDGKNKIDPKKLNALIFETYHSDYYSLGEKVGSAWKSGAEFMKR